MELLPALNICLSSPAMALKRFVAGSRSFLALIAARNLPTADEPTPPKQALALRCVSPLSRNANSIGAVLAPLRRRASLHK
jgi:hypothetical protein